MSVEGGTYELLARTPAGDAAFVRYPQTGLWLLMSSGDRPATDDEVGLAIRNFDFELVNLELPDMDAVRTELDHVAHQWLSDHPGGQPRVVDFDLVDLERVLKRAAEQSEPTRGLRALAARALDECPRATDPSVNSRLRALAGLPPDQDTAQGGVAQTGRASGGPARADVAGPIIRFSHVTMRYSRQRAPALLDVTCSVQPGEFVFLVGPSGSGKSTFVRLILREDTPTAGQVLVLGKDVGAMRKRREPKLRRSIGTVFQSSLLLPNKSVYENVAFPLEVIGRSDAQIKIAVSETLDLVGMADKGERRPHELSGGEQQRVAIARAFINRPSLVIADEPTGNLDPASSTSIMHLLERINRAGTTVLVATRDMASVDQLRNRVIELDEGRVVRDHVRGVYGSYRQGK